MSIALVIAELDGPIPAGSNIIGKVDLNSSAGLGLEATLQNILTQLQATGSTTVTGNVGITGTVPVYVQFIDPNAAASSALMVGLTFDQSDGAVLANAFKRVLTYTVPAGYVGYAVKFSSFQAEVAASRFVVSTRSVRFQL